MNINWYKNYIKSTIVRRWILKTLWFIPNKTMLKIQYMIKLRNRLNFKSPQRFTEKIQLYKVLYKNPTLKKVVDKYEVRKYLEDKGLSKYLVDFYGVYNSVEDINFDKLPNEFIMKATNGGGGTEILKMNKNNLNLKSLKRLTRKWTQQTNSRFDGREFAYHGIKGRIIVEELLKDDTEDVKDYKFFCFNGNPRYVVVDMDRYIKHQRNIYDLEWNHLKIESDKTFKDDIIDKPRNYEEMIELARKLSKEFPFVRVDLYNIQGKVYFGELTFYPWSGYVRFTPDKFDFILGKEFSYY